MIHPIPLATRLAHGVLPAARASARARRAHGDRATGARTLLAILALSIWLASMLGMVHRTLHGHEGGYKASAATVVTAGDDAVAIPAKAHQHASGGLFALFGDHTLSDCNLYDQFSGWHVPLSVPPVVLPIVLPAATFAWLEGEALARWVALFDARGPPSTR
jgi:hypothetical protein